jgi:hypothetical protein
MKMQVEVNQAATHTAAGGGGAVGAVAIYDNLTTLLTGFHGLDAAHAQAASGLIVYALTVVAAVVVMWWNKENPTPPAPVAK